MFFFVQNTNSKYPPGRYDLCPAESMPEPKEVRSKIHTESDPITLDKDAQRNKAEIAEPVSSSLSDGDSGSYINAPVLSDSFQADKLPLAMVRISNICD